MPGMEQGLLPLALLSLRLQEQRLTNEPNRRYENRDRDEWASWNWGPYEPWARPLILLSTGRRGEAATALRTLPDSPHDLLREARLCLAARAALALGDRTTMQYAYAQLLPAAGELAGAGSGALTLGAVAHHLGDLATALGHTGTGCLHANRGDSMRQ
jgi:hypothetical protein